MKALLTILLGLALAGVPAVGMGAAAPDAPLGGAKRLQVSLEKGLVSVDLGQAEAAQVLDRLGREAGFENRLGQGVDKLVLNDKFQDLQLEAALRRLLRGTSYIICKDDAGKVSRVVVWGVPSGDEAAAKGAPAQTEVPARRYPSAAPGAGPQGRHPQRMTQTQRRPPERRLAMEQRPGGQNPPRDGGMQRAAPAPKSPVPGSPTGSVVRSSGGGNDQGAMRAAPAPGYGPRDGGTGVVQSGSGRDQDRYNLKASPPPSGSVPGAAPTGQSSSTGQATVRDNSAGPPK